MKKTLSLIFALIVSLLSVLHLSVSASPWQIIENDPVTVPYATPEIDGNISTDEGWSNIVYMHEDQTGYFYQQPVFTSEIDLYFAYDEWGLYYAASITEQHNAYTTYVYDENGNSLYEKVYVDNNCADYTEEQAAEWLPENEKLGRKFLGNTFEYSTGEDDIDTLDGKNIYGWNGEVFGLSIDPAAKFISSSDYWDDDDFTAFYGIGIFEDDSLRMWRGRINESEITDQVKLSGKTNGNGWILEAGIPWDIIVKDANDMAAGVFTFTKEEIISSAVSNVATMYLDRFYDPEAEMTDTWGRYVTVCKTAPDGTPGHLSAGLCLDVYGIKLTCEPKVSDTTADTTADTDSTETTTTTDTTTAVDATKATDTTKKPASTTKAASTGKPSTGTSSTQTFDAGIAVAVGALAVSTISFVGIKKSKRK